MSQLTISKDDTHSDIIQIHLTIHQQDDDLRVDFPFDKVNDDVDQIVIELIQTLNMNDSDRDTIKNMIEAEINRGSTSNSSQRFNISSSSQKMQNHSQSQLQTSQNQFQNQSQNQTQNISQNQLQNLSQNQMQNFSQNQPLREMQNTSLNQIRGFAQQSNTDSYFEPIGSQNDGDSSSNDEDIDDPEYCALKEQQKRDMQSLLVRHLNEKKELAKAIAASSFHQNEIHGPATNSGPMMQQHVVQQQKKKPPATNPAAFPTPPQPTDDDLILFT
ncbi:hypothetical protein TRFO_19557 [Tritrichomonas foetus]|uniref:Uncharacterized protein n=1 Tax=Tritrichomonas foetus TaxID=1144522 RepID=A0A1J4KMQ1_9EUKA|nr:hypothetical protein TRFO_19557 [Tritrichomonas foetus]|eukprot:OHT10974.1 hypothetical protein TRFO_19557 [Tritrichomonas foetus]